MIRAAPRQIPASLCVPDYAAGSIANIPATVAHLLGIPFAGTGPLLPRYWQALGDGVQRVLLVLIDGFGANLLRSNDHLPPTFLSRADIVDQITSVFPSTTVNALSSFWTGSTPAQHGLIGLNLLFPQFGAIGQTIHWTPSFQFQPDALVRAGQDPMAFLRAPGVGEQFAQSGVPVYSAKYYTYEDSALSVMHGRGVAEKFGGINMTDIVLHLREVLEKTAGSRLYAVAYWHTVDTLSHRYGPEHQAVATDLGAIIRQVEEELLERLSPAARAGTVVIFTGDHGLVETPAEEIIAYETETALQELLLMRPAGEPRVPYFFARQGAVDDLLAYLCETYASRMLALTTDEAYQLGLFGPPPHASDIRGRVGDVIGVMLGNHSFQLPRDVKRGFRGYHGSLTPGEMEIAWIARRLDR